MQHIKKMKAILLFFLLFASTTCSDSPPVYVCSSKYARKYHLNAHCRGLSNCSRRIVQMTLENAKRSGKTLCGYEK
ncbi:MAG: hypothetical protein JWR09_3977 [Mucilaginibacter sp.]|nr:hypothetical protein [Mucilaginibacter sp.]